MINPLLCFLPYFYSLNILFLSIINTSNSLKLVNCNEFAHVDEINTPEDIDGLNQMNRLYMCPKELSKSTFINYNFPSKKREIDLNF